MSRAAGRPFTIAVDAMGGDFAPEMIVKGAVAASGDVGARVVLVGQPDRLQGELALCGETDHPVEIVPAETFVPMDASYSEALRRNSTTSIAVGVEALRRGEADAFISAGHTGAVLAAAFTTLRKLSGIERPAIMALYPSLRGPVAVVDAGANVDCKPEHLRDFARMGSLYMEEVLGVERPTVGLLSIGSEPQKGNKLTRAAWQLLADSDLNFIGNVEGDKVFSGECRVLVCDGFVGNAVLKACEGFGQFVLDSLKQASVSKEDASENGNWRRASTSLRQILDYAEYGGALLLGVNGLCIICHGRSDSRAIANAVKLAERCLERQAVERMRLALSRGGAEG